jgi:oligopeptide/dipeptide ABC transporter ATP-binding protein
MSDNEIQNGAPAPEASPAAAANAAVEAKPAPEAKPDRQPLVRLSGLKKYFPITQGIILQREVGRVHAVDGVDLEVYPGETLGVVGETGCGKSTLGRLACRLLDVTEGSVEFEGRDITSIKGKELRVFRRQVQMIFQDPYSSLNPRKRVGQIIGDPFQIHGIGDGKERKLRVQELMEVVGLNPEHYNRFPAEFSGGQRQRIGVARALALRPKVIICDEPVSALDVSIQAQVINLLEDLQNEFNLTYIFIAHDLSVVRHVSDRVAVMYLGKVVELSDSKRLYAVPKHHYTGALLSAIPVADPDLADKRERVILYGDVPSPIDPPSGCRFHPRCPKAQEVCVREDPPLEPKASGDLAACHFPLEPGEDLAKAKPGIKQETTAPAI